MNKFETLHKVIAKIAMDESTEATLKRAGNITATALGGGGGAIGGHAIGAALESEIESRVKDALNAWATKKADKLIPGVAPRSGYLSDALREYAKQLDRAHVNRMSSSYGYGTDAYGPALAASDVKDAAIFKLDHNYASDRMLRHIRRGEAKQALIDRLISKKRELSPAIQRRLRMAKRLPFVGGALGALASGTGMYYLTKPATRNAIQQLIDK